MAADPSGAPPPDKRPAAPVGMHLQVLRFGKRVAIAIAGGVVILAGIVLAMPLVPGPGLALIILGLAILSLEFERPRTWLARMKAKGVELKERVHARHAARSRHD